MMKNPCVRDCPDRSPVCHAVCEKYQAFAAQCEEERQKRIRICQGKVFSESKKKSSWQNMKESKQGRGRRS